MTPEERLTKLEDLIDKQNTGIQGLIVVGRTCLDSIQELRTIQQSSIEEMRELHKAAMEEMREMSKATDEKLNILIDTVDRIIRRDNGQK